jgi:Domain of unknown function (DUF4262)
MTTHAQHIAKDDLEKIVLANIAEFGWHAVNVIEDDGHPPWTFTIGFYETWEFPEMIIIGRSRATAQHILNTIAIGLDDNHRPDLNTTTTDLIPGAKCFFLEVSSHHYQDYVGFGRLSAPAANPSPLHQIVWPNTDRVFPWNPDVPDSFIEWQPILGPAPKSV